MAATNQREGQGMRSLTKRVRQACSLLTALPPTYTTAHHGHYFQIRKSAAATATTWALSSLTITTGEQRDRKVLQDKWRGSNFWGLSFKRGGEDGCVHREWSTDFHLGAPLGQYFAKPGVCNLLIKVLTLGQLTRLISPGRHVPWPQGKLKHIREYFRRERESFC